MADVDVKGAEEGVIRINKPGRYGFEERILMTLP